MKREGYKIQDEKTGDFLGRISNRAPRRIQRQYDFVLTGNQEGLLFKQEPIAKEILKAAIGNTYCQDKRPALKVVKVYSLNSAKYGNSMWGGFRVESVMREVIKKRKEWNGIQYAD